MSLSHFEMRIFDTITISAGTEPRWPDDTFTRRRFICTPQAVAMLQLRIFVSHRASAFADFASYRFAWSMPFRRYSHFHQYDSRFR